MPAYVNAPFNPAQLLVKGQPTYLFGSLNQHQGDTVFFVTNVALATNVATVTVQITAGEIPTVGSLISIRQTQTSSGLFNVNRAIITAVSITASTGAGTITFALTNANVASVADTGSGVVEVPEVGETLAAGASIACVIQAPDGDSQFTLPVAVTFPGGVLPTAVTVTLQVALHNVNGEFTNVASAVVTVAGSAYTAGPVIQVTLQRGYFYRVIVSGLTIGSATGVVVKVGG